MSRVLDLSVYRQETLDITMPDGALLHVRKPTQAMLIKMLNMRDVDENAPSERIAGAIDGFVLAVLGSNIDGPDIYPEGRGRPDAGDENGRHRRIQRLCLRAAGKPYLRLPHKPGERDGGEDDGEELTRALRAVVEYTGLDVSRGAGTAVRPLSALLQELVHRPPFADGGRAAVSGRLQAAEADAIGQKGAGEAPAHGGRWQRWQVLIWRRCG